MATYRRIANEEKLPEAPVTSDLIQALDLNLDALSEGATGAPRIRGLAAMTPGEYADISPIASLSGTAAIPTYTYTGTLSGFDTTSTTFVTACEITINNRLSGTCRFRGTAVYSAVSTRYSEVRLLKNGVQIAIAASSTGGGGSSASFTVDATVANGDVFTWEVRRIGGSVEGGLSAPSISGDFDPIITVGLPLKQSEV